MRARTLLAAAVLCLVAGSCAGGDTESAPEGAAASPSTGEVDFAAQVEELCGPAAEIHASLYDTSNLASFEKATSELVEAHRDLLAELRALDPPAGLEEELDAYADQLEQSSDASAGLADTSGSPRAHMTRIVRSAKLEVELEKAAAKAELPDVCPPPPGVDVDNTLFVAKANRDCLELVEDVSAAGPLDAPTTAEEVDLVLELGRRLTAGIVRAIERSLVPGIEGLPLDEIVELNERRVEAIDDVEASFANGDFGAYKKASRELIRASRAADRKMNAMGLFWCGKAFRRIPL